MPAATLGQLRQMAGIEVEEGELEVGEYFVQSGSIPGVTPGPSGHLLVLLRAGDPGYEGDYREAVLAISWTRIDAAMSRVWKEERSGWAGRIRTTREWRS